MALRILNFVFITKAAIPGVYWIHLNAVTERKFHAPHKARNGPNERGYSGRTEETLVPIYTLQRRAITNLATWCTRTYISTCNNGILM